MDPVPIPDGWAEANGGQRVVFGPPDGDPTGDVRSCEAIVTADGISILIELDDDDRAKAAAGLPIWYTVLGHGLAPFSFQFAEPDDPETAT